MYHDGGYGGDQYVAASVNNIPDFGARYAGQQMTPEKVMRMSQYGVASNLTCDNPGQYSQRAHYNQRMGLVHGSVDERRIGLLNASQCDNYSTDGKGNDHGKGGSFLNIGGAGAGAEYGIGEAKPEKFHLSRAREGFESRGAVDEIILGNEDLIMLFMFIVLIFISLYCLKSVRELKGMLTRMNPGAAQQS